MSNPLPSRRVLLVDDDPIIIRLYREGLTTRGFEVTTATDGLAALQSIRAAVPDVVVLDLMMPRFSGVEVLRFIRGRTEIKDLPVIVLSNAYMDPLAHDAANLGAQQGLLKVQCNPASLASAIGEVLEGRPATIAPDALLAAPAAPPEQTATVTPEQIDSALAPIEQTPTATDSKEQARHELAAHAEAVVHSLGEGSDAFLKAADDRSRKVHLEVLYRKVHFVTSLAALADKPALSQMAAAFEALLYGMMDKMPQLEGSLRRTIITGIEFLQELLQHPTAIPESSQLVPSVLVIDDDRVSNRLVITALRNTRVEARGTETPELGLRWLQDKKYDLVLLDVDMPGIDGLEVCKRLRALPGYEKTPVIFVTLHSDFMTRARSALSGGNDLIAKPILPTELAVKVVMHLLRSQMVPSPN